MKVALLGGGIVLSLLVWALLRFFWAPYWIPSGSMKPTLLVGDYIAVPTKNSVARPMRGEVYVFRHPVTGATLAARLIGVAGDTIQMNNGSVILNGTPLRKNRSRILPRFSTSKGQAAVFRSVQMVRLVWGRCVSNFSLSKPCLTGCATALSMSERRSSTIPAFSRSPQSSFSFLATIGIILPIAGFRPV